MSSVTWLRKAIVGGPASLACDGARPALQVQQTAGDGAGPGGRGADVVEQVPHHVLLLLTHDRVGGLRLTRDHIIGVHL